MVFTYSKGYEIVYIFNCFIFSQGQFCGVLVHLVSSCAEYASTLNEFQQSKYLFFFFRIVDSCSCGLDFFLFSVY